LSFNNILPLRGPPGGVREEEDLIQSLLFRLLIVKIGTGGKSDNCESDFEVE
jgi:hypothetical protein